MRRRAESSHRRAPSAEVSEMSRRSYRSRLVPGCRYRSKKNLAALRKFPGSSTPPTPPHRNPRRRPRALVPDARSPHPHLPPHRTRTPPLPFACAPRSPPPSKHTSPTRQSLRPLAPALCWSSTAPRNVENRVMSSFIEGLSKNETEYLHAMITGDSGKCLPAPGRHGILRHPFSSPVERAEGQKFKPITQREAILATLLAGRGERSSNPALFSKR